MRYEDFLKELLVREGVTHTVAADLLGVWTQSKICTVGQTIELALTSAFSSSPAMPIQDWAGKSSQAKGNAVANYVVGILAQSPNIKVLPAKKGGFPDEWMEILGEVYAVEMKATGKFPVQESPRTVLLGSTVNLRRSLTNFIAVAPIRQLVIQIAFQNQAAANPIYRATKIYFFQPDTEIKVKFEASTTERLLKKVSSRSF